MGHALFLFNEHLRFWFLSFCIAILFSSCAVQNNDIASEASLNNVSIDYSQSDSLNDYFNNLAQGKVTTASTTTMNKGAIPNPTLTINQYESHSFDFVGPYVCEDWTGTWPSAQPNPFRHARLLGFFTHVASNITLMVPGFFAADGDAANSGATCGNIWRFNFSGVIAGDWVYVLHFQAGLDLSVDLSTTGLSIPPLHGLTGSFTVNANALPSSDPRSKGPAFKLTSEHHLRFVELDDEGEVQYFLKNGADSPENMLGYYEFDDTFSRNAPIKKLHQTQYPNYYGDDLHHYDPHALDFDSADADLLWQGGKGRNILGMINYLEDQGINSIYFLTYNWDGDGNDTWPFLYDSGQDDLIRYNYDVSKLDQWGRVLEGANRHGMMLHMVTQETENDADLGSASGPNPEDLTVERKVYYKELMARFGHFLNLTVNLGEEFSIQSTYTDGNKNIPAFAAFIEQYDWSEPTVVVHTYPNQHSIYDHIIFGEGPGATDGPSVQIGESGQGEEWGGSLGNGEAVYAINSELRTKSLCLPVAGWSPPGSCVPNAWHVTQDEIPPGMEQNFPGQAVSSNNHKLIKSMYANLFAGGAGAEWYYGYNSSSSTSSPWHGDVDTEDQRSRHAIFPHMKRAVDFFQSNLPFAQMEPDSSLSSDSKNYVLKRTGEVYAVFSPRGNAFSLNLSEAPGVQFKVRTYEPDVSAWISGTSYVTGGGSINISFPKSGGNTDYYIVLLEKQ